MEDIQKALKKLSSADIEKALRALQDTPGLYGMVHNWANVIHSFDELVPMSRLYDLPERRSAGRHDDIIYINGFGDVPTEFKARRLVGGQEFYGQAFRPYLICKRSTHSSYKYLDQNVLGAKIQPKALMELVKDLFEMGGDRVTFPYQSPYDEEGRLAFEIEGKPADFWLKMHIGDDNYAASLRPGGASVRTRVLNVHFAKLLELHLKGAFEKGRFLDTNKLRKALGIGVKQSVGRGQKARDKGLSDLDKRRLEKLRANLAKLIGEPIVPPGFIERMRDEIRTIAMKLKE